MQLKKIHKYKRNRRRAENFGMALVGIGFMLMIGVSGENCTLSLGRILLTALIGVALMGLGCLITNYIDRLNEEQPLTYRPVAEGDDLWYNMYINKTKKWSVRK